MTMQSSGQISVGQARNECGEAGQCHAGDTLISRLGGVSPGQTIAWHYWYGKSNLPPIVNQPVGGASMHVDRINQLYINLSNGTWALGTVFGDHGPGLNGTPTVAAVPMIAQYKTWTVSLQWAGGSHRMNVCVLQQPSPANGFVALIEWDDQGSDNAIGHLPGNIPADGENMNGATDTAVTFILNCTA